MSGKVYVATETFATSVKGYGPVTVQKGKTRVREGHPLLEQNPQFFELADDHVHFEVEQASAAPGEKRGQRAAVKKAE